MTCVNCNELDCNSCTIYTCSCAGHGGKPNYQKILSNPYNSVWELYKACVIAYYDNYVKPFWEYWRK